MYQLDIAYNAGIENSYHTDLRNHAMIRVEWHFFTVEALGGKDTIAFGLYNPVLKLQRRIAMSGLR